MKEINIKQSEMWNGSSDMYRDRTIKIDYSCHVENPTKSCQTGGKRSQTKYIINHYTGNSGSKGINNARYFTSQDACNLSVSCNYVVGLDENDGIYAVIDDAYISWAANNLNNYGIQIEVCHTTNGKNIDWKSQATIDNLIWLNAFLCKKYNLKPSKETIKRHYDSQTKKLCPHSFIDLESNEYTGEQNYSNFIKAVEKVYTYLTTGTKPDAPKPEPEAPKPIPTKTKYNIFGYEGEVSGYSFEDHNYIGIRELFEQLHCKVGYDDKTKTVFVFKEKAPLTVVDKIKGIEFELDDNFKIDNYTWVGLRSFLIGLGYNNIKMVNGKIEIS